jgi:hypothetical protein
MCPETGSSDDLVDSHVIVFCVISMTIQAWAVAVPPLVVLAGHVIGRESRDVTVPQLLPLVVTRHTLKLGL